MTNDIPDEDKLEKFRARFTVCDNCNGHWKHTPEFSPRRFEYCPLCGEELPEDNPRTLEKPIGWTAPQI